jgi:hypothetical protein
MNQPTDPLMQIAEALLINRGEIEAIRRAIAALMLTHPDPQALHSALQAEVQGIHRHWENFPDQGAARFRAEELMEQWLDLLRNRTPE